MFSKLLKTRRHSDSAYIRQVHVNVIT